MFCIVASYALHGILRKTNETNLRSGTKPNFGCYFGPFGPNLGPNIMSRVQNKKSVKKLEIITYQPKTFENPNTVDKRLVIQDIQKLLINYTRPLGEAEKVSSNNSLCINAKKVKIF